METYWSKVRATMEGCPINVLAAYGPHVTLEGPEVEGIVVSEFPSIEGPAPGPTVHPIKKRHSTAFGVLSTVA